MNKYKDIGLRPADQVPQGRRAGAEFLKDHRTRVPPAWFLISCNLMFHHSAQTLRTHVSETIKIFILLLIYIFS